MFFMKKGKKEKKKLKEERICLPIGFYNSNKEHSLFCRNSDNPEKIFLLPSKKGDFGHFSKNKRPVIFKLKSTDKKIKLANIDDICYSKVNNKDLITFSYNKGANQYLYWAISKKKDEWVIQDQIPKIKTVGSFITNHDPENKYYVYFGESSIYIAYSDDLEEWQKPKEPILRPRPGFFDNGNLRYIASVTTPKGILVFYDASVKKGEQTILQIGFALFSLTDPCKIIWRADEPIFEDKVPYEKSLQCKGMLSTDSKLAIYWYSKNNGLTCVNLALPFSPNLIEETVKKLDRYHNNPIISPKDAAQHEWVTKGAFNPAAIIIKDKTHLLFRAIGDDGISRVGYASSEDGLNIDEIHPTPVFSLNKNSFNLKSKAADTNYNPILYPSGGSWGGCEDPRMVKIEDKIYMTFNAFDGWNFIRVGYTSIKEEDFLNKKWNWNKPKLISPAGEIHKNWVIFPEKIGGKFAILHSLTPEVQVDYVDKLEDLASGKQVIKSCFGKKTPRRMWDTWLRGAGPPPLKTAAGWLVFYHAISAEETSKYKLGAMLLDLNNPQKILARSSAPILLPDMWYENDWKPGIIYACGSVLNGDTLYIYYGGGDKFVCAATVRFKDFMDSLKGLKETVPFISKVIFS